MFKTLQEHNGRKTRLEKMRDIEDQSRRAIIQPVSFLKRKYTKVKGYNYF